MASKRYTTDFKRVQAKADQAGLVTKLQHYLYTENIERILFLKLPAGIRRTKVALPESKLLVSFTTSEVLLSFTTSFQESMEVNRPNYACAICQTGFKGCIGGMQVGLNKVCGHFYHETCISKFLKGRCDGVIRCLVCGLYFAESDFMHSTTDEEDLRAMKNSVCWICNEELHCRSPNNKTGVNKLLNKNYGSAQNIITLSTCEHIYHRECVELYIKGFSEGMMLCGHCDMHIEGRLMKFRVFKDDYFEREEGRKGESSRSGECSVNKSFSSFDRQFN